MKIKILILLFFVTMSSQAQTLENSTDKVDKVKEELLDSFKSFSQHVY